ncbi:DUF418 domain-containing protein [Oceanobacillus salinisoli]|uniref:DUF418 domain-containing protein n=1 Tax=Oceanobacillus salinisoli TaxID=2678611 RepID=UPI0012E1EFE1|nr:DUF418 domain-containing protein [Oceanobacillus salinisoli]
MNSELTPTQESNRLFWIDAARGFSIFGIFMVNIGAFSAPYFLYGGEEQGWTSSVDPWIQVIIDIFFQASFYTLFSILFGFGIQIMKDRIIARGISLYPFLLRRLFILLCFGMVHAFLLWHGDILLTYGMVGILSLLLLHVRAETKLGIGSVLLVGSVSFLSFLYYISRDYLDFVNHPMIEQSFVNYQSNDIRTIWMQNYQDWVYSNSAFSLFFLTLVLLPLFLFGMFLAEKRWLHEPVKYKSILIKLWVIAFVCFIGFKIGPYAFGNPLWLSYIQDNIGGMFSALFYILSITLLAGTGLGRKLLKPFAYVGRMALTNYISQSIISFILFYGVGFGLYGSVSPFLGVVFVVTIFTGQVFFSRWWFMRFRFGPLEWVWRSLTYWKKQPLRK